MATDAQRLPTGKWGGKASRSANAGSTKRLLKMSPFTPMTSRCLDRKRKAAEKRAIASTNSVEETLWAVKDGGRQTYHGKGGGCQGTVNKKGEDINSTSKSVEGQYFWGFFSPDHPQNTSKKEPFEKKRQRQRKETGKKKRKKTGST